NPIPDSFAQSSRMYMEQFDLYVSVVERARRAMAGKVEVWLGLECDYFPGHEAWLAKQLKSAPFHHVLGSIHPHLSEYRKEFWTGNVVAFQEKYFEHLGDAAETGLFDTISHPDLVKNIAPSEWQVERVMGAIERCLDRIAATGTAMELNTSGLNKSVPEMNPGPAMLKAMAERQIPVVVGADAHVPERVADQYEQAFDLLEAAGYREVHYFLERKRRTVTIAAARESLLKPAGVADGKE
ncbi:MAG TPA: histidinol-phosphatase, partial [Planctomycetota bacterium]|nr:histidinol-phosphatase [Planctomycetota bacterium]